MDDIKEIIENLISLKTEGGYWDFKQEWHRNKIDLLHDIICMANNLENCDAYIIIGVDDEAQICGINDNDKNRMNQQQVIDFLKDKKFAHGCRPTVYVQTIELDNKKIDVILVKNSRNVPYYLIENCKGVLKYSIYTHILDTNTPKNLSADFDKIEYLWKKRFGLDLTSLDKAKLLLKNTKSWHPIGTDGFHSSEDFPGEYFHQQFPEYTIKYHMCNDRFIQGSIEGIESEFYWMNELVRKEHNAYLYKIELKIFSTILYSTFAIFTDSFRFKRTMWKNEKLFKNKSNEYISFCYIEKDSIEYLLDNWLCNSYNTVSMTKKSPIINPLVMYGEYQEHNPYSVILCFESLDEHKSFIKYVKSHQEKFLDNLGEYSYDVNKCKKSYSKDCDPDYIAYLCKSGKLLNDWLKKWR